MEQQEEFAIIISVLLLLLLVGSLITLFIVFVNRKNELLQEKQTIQDSFKLALNKAQIEIREQTLRNISWELHDNIGQLVSLAKINAQLATNDGSKIQETITILNSCLNELRALSKSINPDSIKKLNLVEAIRLEIERYNRLEFIESTLDVRGNIRNINPNVEVILFRILQEFFSNTIKHSKASTLQIVLNFLDDVLEIQVQDNGIGFAMVDSKPTDGLGLYNMKDRATMIGADFAFRSEPDQGTRMNIKYDFNQTSFNTLEI